MANLTGIKDAEYLAQFLGKKIVIRLEGSNLLLLFPILDAIYANQTVMVKDSEGRLYGFKWEQCENPYLILTDPRLEWEQK